MATSCVVEDANVRKDHGIGARRRRLVDRAMPWPRVPGAWKGVDGDEHLAAVIVGVGDTLAQLVGVEVESRVIAGIGAIAESAVHRIGPGIDCGTQGGRRPGRAHELEVASAQAAFSSRLIWRASSRASRAVSAV